VTLSFGGTAFATTTLPPHAAKASVANRFDVHSVVTVTDRAAFTRFSAALLGQDSVTWHLSGRAGVTSTVLGVEQTVANLIFEKDITVAGAGGLRRIDVLGFSLADSTPDEVRVRMDTAALNPSVFAMSGIGAVCVNVTYNGTQVAIARTPALELRRGWTPLTFTGPFAPQSKAAREDLFGRYLGGRTALVRAEGFACEGTSPLFAGAVPAISLGVLLPGSPFPLVHSMDVIGMELVPQAAAGRVGLRLNATVTLNNPLGAAAGLVVEDVGMTGSLFGDGVDVGTLVVPKTHVTTDSSWAEPGGAAPEARAFPPAPQPLPPVAPARLNVTMRVSGEIDLHSAGAANASTEPAFATFVDRFLLNDTVTLGVSSSSTTALETTIRCALGEISLRVPLDIPATVVPAARGIPHVEVESFDIVGQAGLGLAVRIVTKMTNPSTAVVPLGGRCVFGVFGGASHVKLGEVSVANATLKPGVNVLTMTGSIDPPPAGLPFVGEIFTNYLSGVATRVDTRGQRVEPGPGRPAPDWLSHAIADVSLVSALPGLPGVQLFTNMSVSALNLDFRPDGAITVTGRLTGDVHVPFSHVTMDILAVTAVLRLRDRAGEEMATIFMDDVPAHYTPLPAASRRAGRDGEEPPVSGTLIVDVVSPAPMTVLNETALSGFLATSLLGPSVVNTLSIASSQLVSLPFGNVTISNVSATETVTLPGLDSFRSPPPVVQGTTLVHAAPDHLVFTAALNVTSNSPLGGNFGLSALDMYFQGQRIGNSTVQRFEVHRGENLLPSVTIFQPDDTPEAAAAGRRFLSEFLMGHENAVELRGTPRSTPIPVLREGVSQLVLRTLVPGAPGRLISNSTMNISAIGPGTIDGRIGLVNPSALSVTITSSGLRVYVCVDQNTTSGQCYRYGDQIALFTPQDLVKDPILIPPGGSVITKDRPFGIVGPFAGVLELLYEIIADGGVVSTRVNGTENIIIGGQYATTVHYAEDAILTTLVS